MNYNLVPWILCCACCCFLAMIPYVFGKGYGPPRPLRHTDHPLHRIAAAGTTVQLPCPVEAPDPSSLYFDWYKDRVSISKFADLRLHVGSRGSLRIKGALAEDTGHYVCRAINGFGSVEIKLNLIVLDKRPTGGLGDDSDIDADSEAEQSFLSRPASSKGEKPHFLLLSQFNESVVQRLIGGSIRLKCIASGEPQPDILWLKDGLPYDRPLSTSSLLPGSSSHGSSSRKGRWTLFLENLQESDSGNYTCVVHNTFGSINATFVIEVVDRLRNAPELTGGHLSNTTVEYGSTATLHCRVRSDVRPQIQWLKRIDADDLGKKEYRQNVVRVQGDYFRILRASEVVEKSDGVFLNRLVIPEAKESDSGKYLCLGANSMGYSYRTAFLTVLPQPKTFVVGRPHGPLSEASPNQTNTILVAVPVSIGVAIGIIVAVAIHCHRRKRQARAASMALSSAAASHRSPATSRRGTSSRRTLGTASDLETPHWIYTSSSNNWSSLDSRIATDTKHLYSSSEGGSTFLPPSGESQLSQPASVYSAEAYLRGNAVVTRVYSPYAATPHHPYCECECCVMRENV